VEFRFAKPEGDAMGRALAAGKPRFPPIQVKFYVFSDGGIRDGLKSRVPEPLGLLKKPG